MIRHLTTPQVHAEVNACYGKREVSDAAAVTIASWYASPGEVGRHLAALATGADVTREDLIEDVSSTILEHWDGADDQEQRDLSMLGTWVQNRVCVGCATSKDTVLCRHSNGDLVPVCEGCYS